MRSTLLLFTLFVSPVVFGQNLVKKISGATSTNGAEISAYDPASKNLYVVAGTVVEYYSLQSNGALSFVGALPTGFTPASGNVALPNSVAIKDGLLAVAWAIVNQTSNAQQRGVVSFHNAADGSFIDTVTVGYLPDMIVFHPSGTKILTANEGEPNSYNQPNSFDPEGSVSIIDISNGAANATVKEASFVSFNNQATSLKAVGVRIFGPNATVAQDVEPEYIAFSSTGDTAVVTLQENNALALVDVKTATILKISSLGLKDHNGFSTTLDTYTFTNLPSLGKTIGNQDIKLGGFSGLHYEGKSTNGKLKFVTHTDRGPNGEPTGVFRPFMLPNFTPEIVRFELDTTTGQLAITQRIPLKLSNGTTSLTGLPNIIINNNGNTPYNDEYPVDLLDDDLSLDLLGADLEGVVINPNDNTFWMVDEYRPAIYHFSPNGVLINRYVPAGTAAAAGKPVGTYGIEALPAVIAQRRQNRGFEGVALDAANNKLYAFVQSPLRNPASISNSALNGMNNIRIVEFDINTKSTTAQYLYQMDNTNLNTPNNTRPDKIGDAVYAGKGEFLVVERDDDAIPSGDPISNIEKKIYKFSLNGATNINGNDSVYKVLNKSIDQMSLSELTTNNINPIKKALHIDLAKAGYVNVEKVEGLTLIDSVTVVVLNDNDFQVGGVPIDTLTGTFVPDATPEPIVLGIIEMNSNGMDASDRDLTSSTGKINIVPQPVFGMYMPDAISSYQVGGKTYYVTANEGDSRAYTGYSEEIRVGSANYVLDAAKFPNATTLKNNANLGRLQLSNASGDLDTDGDFDQIHALGARSFSIWDNNGMLIYDSGDDFEQITAFASPNTFNSDGTASSFDTRSDNKGPEPEGVAIGSFEGKTYAFIGLERTGDMMVYDISNPFSPSFVQYTDAIDDVSPEGLTYIHEANSPTKTPLVIITSEVSKTIAVYQVGKDVLTSDNLKIELTDDKGASIILYPNPITKDQSVTFSAPVSGSVYNSLGVEVDVISNTTTHPFNGYSSGIYTIKTTHGNVLRVIVQ